MPSVGHQLKNECHRLRDAGLLAIDDLELAFAKGPIKDLAYAIKGRVKSAADIVAKVHRKRTDKKKPRPTYESWDVTDVCGLRVVTLFQPDIIEVAKYLLLMVTHDGTVTHSPFIKNELREVLLFSNRPENDPLSVYDRVIEEVKKAGFGQVVRGPEASESGYSSIHFGVKVQVALEGEDGRKSLQPFPVEIQLRTVFEDAWGEVDHKLRYVLDRATETQDRNHKALTWLPHLNALKTYVDGCSQYADIIKKQAIDSSISINAFPSYLNAVDTVQDALRAFEDYPQPIKEALRAAYAARERLQKATSLDVLLETANETIAAFVQIENDQEAFLSTESPQASLLKYHLRMEQAFGSLSKRDDDSVQAAIDIYSGLLANHPRDAVVHYRLGRAFSMRGDVDKAIENFDAGLRWISSVENLSAKHWLRSALPRNLAYNYWAWSKKLGDSSEDARQRTELLLKAHQCSQQAVSASAPGSMQEVSALNSLVFFGVELLRLSGEVSNQGITRESVRQDFERLKVHIDIKNSTEIARLDTLCRYYLYCGDRSLAVPIAGRLLEVIQNSDEATKSEHMDVGEFAASVVAGIDG